MNKPLMSYIGSNPTQGARKYTGSVATGYDAKREKSPKWQAEQKIIENFIDWLPKKSRILDIPVGTGRFIPAYERNSHLWIGCDLSGDMLTEANKKRTDEERGTLVPADVTKLSFSDEFFDAAIMCRLTRWLTPEQRTQALKQLQRVSRRFVLFTARTANHPYAYPVEEIEAALEPGWKIGDNIEAGEPDYRVILLEHER